MWCHHYIYISVYADCFEIVLLMTEVTSVRQFISIKIYHNSFFMIFSCFIQIFHNHIFIGAVVENRKNIDYYRSIHNATGCKTRKEMEVGAIHKRLKRDFDWNELSHTRDFSHE